MLAKKTPEWESKLWSHIKSSNGEHCPAIDNCAIRLNGGWCPEKHGLRIARLLDSEQFNMSDYDFIQPGSCGGILELVQILANKLLRERNISYPPVPTELALGICGNLAEIRWLPLKAFHGATWYLEDGIVIQIKEDDPSTMQRLTLFHEIFHVLARNQSVPLFRRSMPKHDFFNEVLAGFFASCILIPDEWLKEKWAEVHDLDLMVDIFNAPKSLICLRLKRLALL